MSRKCGLAADWYMSEVSDQWILAIWQNAFTLDLVAHCLCSHLVAQCLSAVASKWIIVTETDLKRFRRSGGIMGPK